MKFIKDFFQSMQNWSEDTRRAIFWACLIPVLIAGAALAGWFFRNFMQKIEMKPAGDIIKITDTNFNKNYLENAQESFSKAQQAQQKLGELFQEVNKYQNATNSTSALESMKKLEQEFGVEINGTTSVTTSFATTTEMPIEEIKQQ